jgi:glycosyltransferase involved in cell wall biosynthesis
MVGHSCVTSWWDAVHGEEAPERYDHYRAALRYGLEGATTVIAPSAAMLGALKRYYGPFRDGRLIANGIDLRLFAPATKQPHILGTGRLWDAAKNLIALKACAAGLPWPVYIAGPARGPDDAYFEGAPCRMLGALSRPALRAELARAAIYVAPARYEPFGLAVLEAAASGCALVLGRIPSLQENWSGAAEFVDPADHDELGFVLRELIDDDARRGQLQASARARSRSFRAETMTDSYHALYAELIGRISHEQVSCAS